MVTNKNRDLERVRFYNRVYLLFSCLILRLLKTLFLKKYKIEVTKSPLDKAVSSFSSALILILSFKSSLKCRK